MTGLVPSFFQTNNPKGLLAFFWSNTQADGKVDTYHTALVSGGGMHLSEHIKDYAFSARCLTDMVLK